MTPLISVIIPTRPHEPILTMDFLMAQTFQRFEVHLIVDTELRGCGWARNQGVPRSSAPYILFSDNDIRWVPTALEELHGTLVRESEKDPRVGYAYSGYHITFPDRRPPIVQCMEPWDLNTLKSRNLVSPMVLIRREVFQPFDETLPRFEDWDLWLRLGLAGIRGAWIQKILFTTDYRSDGITFGGMPEPEARQMVLRKHGFIQ